MVKISQTKMGRGGEYLGKAKQENWVSMECWSGVWGNGYLNRETKVNFEFSITPRRR